jgi:hypothetical protein
MAVLRLGTSPWTTRTRRGLVLDSTFDAWEIAAHDVTVGRRYGLAAARSAREAARRPTADDRLNASGLHRPQRLSRPAATGGACSPRTLPLKHEKRRRPRGTVLSRLRRARCEPRCTTVSRRHLRSCISRSVFEHLTDPYAFFSGAPTSSARRRTPHLQNAEPVPLLRPRCQSDALPLPSMVQRKAGTSGRLDVPDDVSSQ